jgi:hypothetical protein
MLDLQGPGRPHGRPHGLVTGDTRTRYDVLREEQAARRISVRPIAVHRDLQQALRTRYPAQGGDD